MISGLLTSKDRKSAEMVDDDLKSNKRKLRSMAKPLLIPKMENLYDYDFESNNASDNFEDASEDDQNTSQNKSCKRKKYHRHSAFQIKELEASFEENPHPDEKSRTELGKRLGLLPRQIKFWFQNRRTQVKTQVGRQENSILKQENDKLRMENIAMKEAMKNPICNNCGGAAILSEIPMEEQHLMLENARLKDELDRLNVLASNGTNGSIRNSSLLDLRNGIFGSIMDPTILPIGLDFGNPVPNGFPMDPTPGMNSVDSSFDKSLCLELALAAMNELIKLTQLDSPLWCGSLKGSGDLLNFEEYMRLFSSCLGVKPDNFVSEGTRAAGTVMIESSTLVKKLMDVDEWTRMFPWNIGKALTVHVVSSGMGGNRSGALQLMQAEFQVLSPMVPVRQVQFIRFCKQHSEDIWAVVDVSVDTIFPSLAGNPAMICRRLPSGCIVQDLANGYSKVTWVEHMEYDENIVHHLYRSVLRSGMAFGAQKWIVNLQRQCELFPVIMSMPSNGENSELAQSGRKSIAELAQRMTRIFCTGICATIHNWEVIQISDDSKLIMRRTTNNSGEPPGVILCATTTIWIPVSPYRLLEFLRDEKLRVLWDILSQDGPMQQIVQIPKSHDPGNNISILRTSVLTTTAYQSNVMILQDTCTDASGSLIVHAAVDIGSLNLVLNGDDSSSVTVLPSGFVIVPDCGTGDSGSLLTTSFQILTNCPSGSKLTMQSVETIKSLIARTIQGIKTALHCD